VCREVLSSDQEVETQPELLKQTDLVRVKNRSVAATEPGEFIGGSFIYPPDQDSRVQEEAMEVTRAVSHLMRNSVEK
jgi:hypothetical protein